MQMRSRLFRFAILLCCGPILAPSAACAGSAVTTLQQCFVEMQQGNVPGALLSTSSTRHPLTYTFASGVSDITTGTPISPHDRFRIGSITKTFVATVVLQLVGQKQLSLDDTLTSLLGAEAVAAVPYADQITVKQLLNMTSGVYDYNDNMFIANWLQNPAQTWTPQEIVDTIQGKNAYFAPGSSCADCGTNYCYPQAPGTTASACWKYSNTNYILLGMIVEKVTGHPLPLELSVRILRPLGLADTSFPLDTSFAGLHSHGYTPTPAAGTSPPSPPANCPVVPTNPDLYDVTTCLNPTAAWAAGAMISSVHDLKIFLAALVDGSLLRPAEQTERLTLIPASLDSLPIGYGLGIMEINGFLGHGGEYQGYASVMFQSRACKLQIVDAVNSLPQANNNPFPAYATIFLGACNLLCPAQCPQQVCQ